MSGASVRIPIEKYDIHDVFFSLSVLRKLPEYTRELEEGSSETLYRIIHSSICAARWYYRRYSRYGEFVHLLNTYAECIAVKSSNSALRVAELLAARTSQLHTPQLWQRLPLPIAASLLFAVICCSATVILIGIGEDCCRKADVAALILSCVSVLCLCALFPLIYASLRRRGYKGQERLVDRMVRMACDNAQSQNSFYNPLSDRIELTERVIVEDADAFLVEADIAHRNRRAIAMLLTEATEDEGSAVLRSRGLPPAMIGLNAIYRHTIIIMTDFDGKVVMWSDGAATCFGFSARDVEGNNIISLLYGERSVELYATMTEAAEKNLDLSEKVLTVAHMGLGTVSISATVVVSREAKSNQPVGFTLIGSVRSDELSQTQAVLHSFFVAELSQLSVKDSQFRQIVDCLRWKNLRDLSALARDWRSAHIRQLLSEVIKGRQRYVSVEVDPKVTELPPILCDTVGITAVLNRAFELFCEKIRVRVEQKRTTSAVYQLIVVYRHDMSGLNRNTLIDITRSANDLGGIVVDSPGTLKLLLPFMVKDEAIQALRPQGAAAQKPIGHDPLIVLLLEKNAVHRHNISASIWSCGHSLRLVENVRKALQAIEGSTDLGCAIIDVDVKGSDRVIEALLAKHICIIETSEALDGGAKRGDALLKKPISNEALRKELEKATYKCEEAKRAGEELLKRREVFGKVRNSPWTQGRLLGRGGHAAVYEATSTLTGGKMAVKIIRVSGNFEEHIDEFMNEIGILCKLTHPNIIHYFYCERTETTLNLFMAMADQGTVADLIKRCPRLPENHVATITKQLLQAVNYLHECGIIHRDIKPGNMLISQGQLKLSDFGTATTNVREGTVGTISYMAPEVVDGKPSGKESDIWSIGCVVCECLQIKRSGDGLLGYGAPEEYPSDVSAQAIDFIKACMQRNPSERATTGTLLLHDFIVHLDQEVSQLAEVLPEAAPNEEGAKTPKARSSFSDSTVISWSFD
ncbi:mitogen activated kinase-like protein [Leishmania donovani]|uniref:Mitogen_activated_kinase-like_protein/GeneDB:LmjF.36.3680 n=1 Tax=Leishmania donovani TaxID=5661 RepID=A0A6J8FP67_LEIDO|nr:mitogen activated kinase-like protein [Leishmania donovani]VDZ49581.1 mitogen_activated_kinase-like_protein/GeneDB:LmjF.36.3680 [Leishmania donovani]